MRLLAVLAVVSARLGEARPWTHAARPWSLLQTRAALAPAVAQDAPDCTERVSQEGQWSDWHARAGMEKEATPLAVWNALNGTGLLWLHFVDGWAVVRDGHHGKAAFQGASDSKNGNPDSTGDFLGFASESLDRIQSVPMEEELTAKKLQWIIAPVQEGVGQDSSCTSEIDLFTHSSIGYSKCFGGQFEMCDWSHMDQVQFTTLKSELDPLVYSDFSMRDTASDRLLSVQRYLDEYYGKVRGEISADAKLDALAQLAQRYAQLHPFCDGNGRMRNLLLGRELVRLGFHPALMFDYNREIYYQTRAKFKEDLLEGFFMWEDAVRHGCVPWTADAVKAHRKVRGPTSVGLPEQCTPEAWDALGGEYECEEA